MPRWLFHCVHFKHVVSTVLSVRDMVIMLVWLSTRCIIDDQSNPSRHLALKAKSLLKCYFLYRNDALCKLHCAMLGINGCVHLFLKKSCWSFLWCIILWHRIVTSSFILFFKRQMFSEWLSWIWAKRGSDDISKLNWLSWKYNVL